MSGGKAGGAVFFGVFAVLGVVVVLAVAVLFDVSALHSKLDAVAETGSAAPSAGGPMEDESAWKFKVPAPEPVPPSAFPPIVVEKEIIVERPTPDGVRVPPLVVGGKASRPWWCPFAVIFGAARTVCSEVEASPGVSPPPPVKAGSVEPAPPAAGVELPHVVAPV